MFLFIIFRGCKCTCYWRPSHYQFDWQTNDNFGLCRWLYFQCIFYQIRFTRSVTLKIHQISNNVFPINKDKYLLDRSGLCKMQLLFWTLERLTFQYHRKKYSYKIDSKYISSHSFWWIDRSSHSEVFLGKGVLKICNKFTGEHPCQSVTLLHIFRTPFYKNTSEWLLLMNWLILESFSKNKKRTSRCYKEIHITQFIRKSLNTLHSCPNFLICRGFKIVQRKRKKVRILLSNIETAFNNTSYINNLSYFYNYIKNPQIFL